MQEQHCEGEGGPGGSSAAGRFPRDLSDTAACAARAQNDTIAGAGGGAGDCVTADDGAGVGAGVAGLADLGAGVAGGGAGVSAEGYGSAKAAKTAKRVISAAERGEAPAYSDILALLHINCESTLAQKIIEAADALSHKLAHGRGYIYAQIGLDARPCPAGCDFCAFAAQYATEPAPASRATFPTKFDMTPHDFDARIEFLAACEVDLVSIMASAAYPARELLRAVHAAADALPAGCDIMVNAADMSAARARELASAGATAAYHALRFGEGIATKIAPDVRLRTMENIRAAGLELMSGLEPLATDTPAAEVARNMYMLRELAPFCTGVCAITPAKGTSLEGAAAPTHARVRYVAALLRLVCNDRVPLGCSGGIKWVDAGADPRTRGYSDSRDALKQKVVRARNDLQAAGWRC